MRRIVFLSPLLCLFPNISLCSLSPSLLLLWPSHRSSLFSLYLLLFPLLCHLSSMPRSLMPSLFSLPRSFPITFAFSASPTLLPLPTTALSCLCLFLSYCLPCLVLHSIAFGLSCFKLFTMYHLFICLDFSCALVPSLFLDPPPYLI